MCFAGWRGGGASYFPWTVSTYDQLVFEWTDYEILPPLGQTRPLPITPLGLERFLAW